MGLVGSVLLPRRHMLLALPTGGLDGRWLPPLAVVPSLTIGLPSLAVVFLSMEAFSPLNVPTLPCDGAS